MSSIALSGNAAGAGVFTIASPNSASSFTATLPAATTTLVGTDATQTLTNKTLTAPNFNSAQVDTVSGTAPLYFARAWVNFNGTGTVAIRASGNVSSITDNSTGDYTVNFTTAMTDANYSVSALSRITSTGVAPVVVNLLTTTTPTASLFRICADRNGIGPTDPEYVFASVFR